MNFQIVKAQAWMSIDNAVANQMALAGWASNVSIVEWREGRGEIEYNDRPSLRETFINVMPYAPYFQEFMTKLAVAVPPLTLAQAKKVQADLILTIYTSKRQLPYAYAIGATSYTWEATDAATAAMMLDVVPASLTLVTNTVGFLNSQVIGYSSYPGNTLNYHLQGGPDGYAAPGLTGNIPQIPPYPNAIQWIPIERTSPIILSIDQAAGIMSGISARGQTLNGVRATKASEVNALTTVAAVIAYNVTTGWPA